MAIAEPGSFHDFLPLLSTVKQTPESAMWLTYDQEADVLYVNFRKPSIATDSELTEDDVIIRYNEDNIVGFTILHASKRGANGTVTPKLS